MSSNFNARDAQAYDNMMGRWSARLAPKFIAHAGVADGENVLDLGCGTGNVSFAMPESIGSVIGVDYSPIYVAAAQHRNTRPTISIEQGDGNALRFDDDSFDRALSMLVIQHVPEPLRVLGEMSRVTKPGGRQGAPVPSSITSSAGGSTLPISVISPSAGEIISPSPCGVTRLGLRKNDRMKIDSAAKGTASTCQPTSSAATMAAPLMAANLRPSGWMEGQCQLALPRP